MRLKLTAALMMLCLLLASCSAAENEVKDALAFRSALSEHGCAYTAHVTTSIGERAYAFSLACKSSGLTNEIEVIKPESISGITATVTETDSLIVFDGVSLEFGMLDDALRSPLYAPAVFASGWLDGYIDSTFSNGEQTTVTYKIGYGEEQLILESRFSGDAPLGCEVYRGEQLLLSAVIEDFTFLS